jgi:hypothetical protein
VKNGAGAEMQKYLDVFNVLKAERGSEFQTPYGLVIKTGEGLGAAILKVMRPSWSTDKPDELLNTNGLFFSIWVDAACEEKAIVRYNLHAKKLRFIKGEAFAARDFARRVRADAKSELATWPNCTIPTGPITLLEGHFTLDDKTLHDETSKMMDRFAQLTPLLDGVLAD